MSGFGALFKQRRMDQQLTLDEVHRRLMISVRNIENLEAENWAELPDDVFVKGYVKRYARLLQLDGDEMWNLALSSRETPTEHALVEPSAPKATPVLGQDVPAVPPVVIDVDIEGLSGANDSGISTELDENENVKASSEQDTSEAFYEPKSESPVVTPRTKRTVRTGSTKSATELARQRAALERANGQLTLTNNVSILPKIVNQVQLRPILTTATAEPSSTSNEELQQSSYNASPEILPDIPNASVDEPVRFVQEASPKRSEAPRVESSQNALSVSEAKPHTPSVPPRVAPEVIAQPKMNAAQSKYTMRIKFVLLLMAICMTLMTLFIGIVVYQRYIN